MFIAIAEGFFEDEGLDVTAQPAQGGAAAVPAMIAGDMQAAFATYPSFLLAQSGGIGINIVAEGVRGNEESNGVWVKTGLRHRVDQRPRGQEGCRQHAEEHG